MNIKEFQNVKIDGITFPDVEVHGLEVVDFRVDHNDTYGYGESAIVITKIDFDLVVINLYGNQIEIDKYNNDWESVKKQVSDHVLADHEFMSDWQEMEYNND